MKIKALKGLTSTQERTYRGLGEISELIAGLYLDAVMIMREQCILQAKVNLVAHCAREIDGGLRDIFAPVEAKKIVEKTLSGEQKGHHASILIALGNADKSIAAEWLDIATKFAGLAHRNYAWANLREFSEIEHMWHRYEKILLLLAGSVYAIRDRIDQLTTLDMPNEAIIGALRNLNRGEKNQYQFFRTLDKSAWFEPLYEAGLFDVQAVTPVYNKDGRWILTDWLPLSYLARIAPNVSAGNIYKTLSAYTTAQYFSGTGTATGLPYAAIQNPPNPDLRWERISNLNLGIDWTSRNNRFSGTLELYNKQGIDLIGNTPYAPQTGITLFTGNTANTRTNGIDLTLNSRNMDGNFKWYTTLLFSYNQDKVTRYLLNSTNVARDYLSSAYSLIPTVGKPPYAVYSYPWAGLDPKTGDPQGYLKGAVSKDYAGIIANATPDNIIYNGSARPVTYGAFRNTFSYDAWTLSANISYRLGYYNRRESIIYAGVLSGNGGHGDYGARWQQPGDEAITQVPSVPATTNANRDNFYANSAVLVEKGDHIRLQDITLSYELTKARIAWLPFRSAQLYGYANNLGIIWKATHSPLDPDALTGGNLPSPKTFAIGLKADFN